MIENILAARIKERSCFSLSIFLDVSPHMTSRGRDVPIPLCVTEYHELPTAKVRIFKIRWNNSSRIICLTIIDKPVNGAKTMKRKKSGLSILMGALIHQILPSWTSNFRIIQTVASGRKQPLSSSSLAILSTRYRYRISIRIFRVSELIAVCLVGTAEFETSLRRVDLEFFNIGNAEYQFDYRLPKF